MRMAELCFLLFSRVIAGLAVSGQQEPLQVLNLDETDPFGLHFPFHDLKPLAIGVFVHDAYLPAVSSSILGAETWLRTHIFNRYPSKNISVIIVGRSVLCDRGHERAWGFVRSAVKNLYHSLTRWGLQDEIKVSAALSSDCLDHLQMQGRFDPLLRFFGENSLRYIVEPSPYSSHTVLYSVHRAALESSGVDISILRAVKSIGKKLLSSEITSSSHFAPVPDSSLSFAPGSFPDEIPSNPPEACLPIAAPEPSKAEDQNARLWCVAKPTVPDEKLQEAMDYACGEGGAECEEIKPDGRCYLPDTIVAHASYAFNSYWQMTKNIGGSCSFYGTALLINSDPSFQQCKYALS
ncbi:hypothetical protein HPP92_005786 [Vanilla planifolia]|uniref:X8 domain-containing protein n=1 Tax=Vanilla planifolia TaxID=51239 RepID=A0A835RQR0_VANPL|nr:hypothetical protein HPP92_006073 [Vanilla planifolia]KAG0494792.1 hypothetical protein HPP92_005786 [Vanilla planifolia]